MKKIRVEGYEEFSKTIAQLENEGKEVIVNFSGSSDKSGKSWCPDCVAAEPIIEEVFKSLPDNFVYLYVGIGTREEFRKSDNPFRKHAVIKLNYVPTLLRWKKSGRLEDKDCAKKDLLELLIEDDD